jgi:metal-sulfur cluster biosynthetic enzyme
MIDPPVKPEDDREAVGTMADASDCTGSASDPQLPARDRDSRVAAVRTALDMVLDPELDESVVSLGFVDQVAVDGAAVAVRFRLPTAWCSLNFAWIMAEDMREALHRLDWVERADIRLVDHFAAERINAGIADGRGFATAFGAEAGGDLAALRHTFRRKAFLGRMSTLIEALRRAGHDDAAILALTVRALGELKSDASLAAAVERYLALRDAFGGPAGADDPAFRTAESAAIDPARLTDFLRGIRMTRRGVEANGEMCRVMLKARYGEAAPPALRATHQRG